MIFKIRFTRKNGDSMTTLELVNKILDCKNRKEVERLLNKNRIPVEKSKYC